MALLVLMIIITPVFALLRAAQRTFAIEQNRIDVFDAARNSMQQLAREISLTGYPPANLFAATSCANLGCTAANSNRVAATFVAVSATDLQVQADTDGDGIVETVEYALAPTTRTVTDGAGRAWTLYTLTRSDVAKTASGG